MSSPDFAELGRYIEQAMEDWQVPGLAITVVEGDSVLIAQGFGVRRLGSAERVDPRTLFGIMSVTKPFTATAVALLVDEGQLSWDDPVIQHLPGFRVSDPVDTREIRVRDLLSHRTGYQEEPRLWRTPGITREALHTHLASRPRQAPLRTRYLYSNQQYLVMGDLIEAVSGLTWEEFVQQRLFAPLGMTQSTATYRAVRGRSNLVSAHTRSRSGSRWTLQPIDRIDPDLTAPAGGIFSNAEEMGAWLRLHTNHGMVGSRRLLGAEPILEMQRSHISFPDARDPSDAENPFCRVVECDAMGYGLGWVVMTYRGERAVVHSGGLDGQNAFVGLLPDRGIGAAALVNRDESDLAPALVYRVFDLLLRAEPIDWSTELRRRFGS